MTRSAKAEDTKRRSRRAQVNERLQQAILRVRELEAKGVKPNIRAIARAEDINVNHVTLTRRLNGLPTMDEYQATKTKLSEQQEVVLVQWIIEMADRNLALCPAVVHERALQLLQSTNPNATLGLRWFRRFVVRHHDKLSCHWSRPFDKVRAFSATPAAMDGYFRQYFSIVGEDGSKLDKSRQFAYDESGVLRGMGIRSRVVSSRNNKAAKVNCGGSRELITFVPIICATGELVTSLAVFPGKLLREDWVKSNPGGFA